MPVSRSGAPLGNQNSSHKYRAWGKAIDRAIAQDDGKRLREAAEKLLSMAAEGDIPAIRELGDRLDGKPAQAVTLMGDAENPLQTVCEVRFVKPTPASKE